MRSSKKSAPDPNHSLKTIALFCVVVFLLIGISLTIRTFQLWQQSKFDGKRNFTIALSNDRKRTSIVTFDPLNKTTSVLLLSSATKLPPIGKTLGIPIDEELVSPQYSFEEPDVAKQLVRIASHFQNVRTDLTIIDVLRLALFAKTTSTVHVTDEELVLSENTVDLTKTHPDAFVDTHIVNEDLSIAIVNATGVAGLGKRLERLVTLIGGDVISVTSPTSVQQHSQIVYQEGESYTVARLQELLGIPSTVTEEQIISDIIITIGTDNVATTIF